ncbi:hypothetical protein WMY93_020267 [Mugilogobius chulae]|uniref:Rho guanine nucleotide exchange factor 3 n=1 Tax=Mugilogobius chulae TaxID=88201 RepID=A0AAW0NKW9_9GOBI
MTQKANMKVPCYEPSCPNNVEKSFAADAKVPQLHESPVKEPHVFKTPFSKPQSGFTRAVHNKENSASRDHERTIELEDSGYLSLHNSQLEEADNEISHRRDSAVYQDKHVSPKASPVKCPEENTPESIFTPINLQKKRKDTCSMSSTPADRHHILPILRFEQAVCEALAENFQKTKRYDFGIIPELAEEHNLDRVIGGQMMVEHVDVFSSLLSRNMKCILARILALLEDLDLISCRKVSKTWRQIIHEDLAALKRCEQAEKALRESEQSQKLPCGLTRDVMASRVVLSSMQRVASSPAPNKGNASSSLKARTPNCSRFNQYVEAASGLKQHESLRPCKRCGSPATHCREAQRATCSRPSCQFDFCTGCNETFHGSTPCRVVQLRSHKTSSSSLLPGSARSKRNMQKNDSCAKRSRWKLQKWPSSVSLQPEARPETARPETARPETARPNRGKKRKQENRDVDSLSLCSLEINEPSTKRSKPVSRVTSLVNLLPPVKAAPLKRIGLSLQRSISLRTDSRPEHAPPRLLSDDPRVSTATASSCSKRRDSKLWSETFDVRLSQTLSPKEIKRQEAIFELVQGEQDLVEDLKLAKKAYHDPMRTLCIMTEQELNQIFGTLDSLIPLHEDLLSRLRDERRSDGCTEHVGHILTQWLPCLSEYTAYCCNQVKAKALLDQKKHEGRVQDFLQRCLLSPFSRKLELWSFLDIPRSRLVKYPLLLREILRHTDNDHPDRQRLEEAMAMVQTVVADINRQTGESECEFYKERLLYSEEGQKHELIDCSRTLSCHGELKNHRGVKLHIFLFQDVLVITRSVSTSDQPIRYQLCRQPIPIEHLELEDLSDGEMRVGGSIRGAFSNNERTKNFFRVSSKVGGQSHCFQASDAFNKQQWINRIRQAKATPTSATATRPGSTQDEPAGRELDNTPPNTTEVNGQELDTEPAKDMEVEEDSQDKKDEGKLTVTDERLEESRVEEENCVEISDELNKKTENRDANRAEMDSIQETEESMQEES